MSKHAINSKNVEEVMVGMSIGVRLKHLRSVKKMTQKELASAIGTKQPSIARVEDNNYLPSLSFLIKIASVLGKRVEVKIK